jgi:GNAT superfamily N-acetyltransferase
MRGAGFEFVEVPSNYTIFEMIVQLQEADLPLVLDYRLRMMTEAGGDHLLADDWRSLTQELYAQGYREGSCAHFGWRNGDRIVACAGVMIRDDFPHFTFKARRYGWVMDVYVLPEFRRKGIALKLTAQAVAWLRARNVLMAKLVASDAAKQAGLYEKLGFKFSSEMRLSLTAAAP